MKAVLRFDMTDVDDSYRFKQMMAAADMAGVLWDITQKLREYRKYRYETIAKQTGEETFADLDEELLNIISAVNLEDIYA